MKDVKRVLPSEYARKTACWSLSILVLHLTGCILIEPNPATTVEDVSQNDVPKRVLRAFEQEHPGSTVIRIERVVFHSRLKGYPTWYRFTCTSPNGRKDQIVLDKKGRLSAEGVYFSQRAIQMPTGDTHPRD